MSLTAIFDDESNDLTGEIHMAAGVFDVVENGGAGIKKRCRSSGASSIDSEIERKLEFTAHGGNAADNVGPVNGTAVPSVGGEHGSFDPEEGRAAVGAGNGDGFVQISKEAFDADDLVVAAGSGVEANT